VETRIGQLAWSQFREKIAQDEQCLETENRTINWKSQEVIQHQDDVARKWDV